MTRYCRPNTVCSCGEKLTSPESVGTFLNFCICAASAAPFVLPPVRLSAARMPSIAAGPVTNAPVLPALAIAAWFFFASAFTARTGSFPKADANVT